MPTPVAHSLIGLSLGLASRPPDGEARFFDGARLRWLAWAVALSNAPDLDYIPGILSGEINRYHHLYTHSLGWILLVSGGLWFGWRAWNPRLPLRVWGWFFLFLLFHLLADLVTADGRPPYGIMLFWPLSDRYFLSPVSLFPRVYKLTWSEVFHWHNVFVMLYEAVLTAPLAALGFALGRMRERRALRSG